MIYARDMPQLTPELRLERMPPLDGTRIRLNAAAAADIAQLGRDPTRLVLLSILNRPAYRFFVNQASVTVFADTGQLLEAIDPATAMEIAGRFVTLPGTTLHYVGALDKADQWTIGLRRQMPLHKIVVEDEARSELYVSDRLGEVVLLTTRGSRALAWVAAIPHWLYFAPLRTHDALWRQIVLWTSGLGVVATLVGLVLAVIQFAPPTPFRWTRVVSAIPYAGAMWWHYVFGVIFGMFALTWVFSGMLSMEPWFWASDGGTGSGIHQALMGGALDPSLFPPVDPSRVSQALQGDAVKEVEFVRRQGNPYYVVNGSAPGRVLIAAGSFDRRRDPFSVESILKRVEAGNPGVPVSDVGLLSAYDSYYYARDRRPPLPVLRVKFDDPDATWFYIDPAMSQIVGRYTRRERLQRWLYNGLHSLDFSFWYYSPFWDVGVIGLCSGGAVLSAIGVVIGFKRVRRSVKRRPRSSLPV
jgi:hypothetical protein